MMYKKARLFGDEATAKRILEEPAPANQQKLGRQVSGFDARQWDNHKVGIVWYGNYLKFSQHQDLRMRLLATGNKILAEASPYDLIWGIGYRAKDEKALDPAEWRGQNLLGQVLMSVRSTLQMM